MKKERCVCGYPKERHSPGTLVCPGKTDTPANRYGTRDLPEGMTCADCFHFKRTCEWLISYKGTETACDWYPIRFVGPFKRAQAEPPSKP